MPVYKFRKSDMSNTDGYLMEANSSEEALFRMKRLFATLLARHGKRWRVDDPSSRSHYASILGTKNWIITEVSKE